MRWSRDLVAYTDRQRQLAAIARDDVQTVHWLVRHTRNLLPTDPRWLEMDDIEIALEYYRLLQWRSYEEKRVFLEDDSAAVVSDAYALKEYLIERGLDPDALGEDLPEPPPGEAPAGFVPVADDEPLVPSDR